MILTHIFLYSERLEVFWVTEKPPGLPHSKIEAGETYDWLRTGCSHKATRASKQAVLIKLLQRKCNQDNKLDRTLGIRGV